MVVSEIYLFKVLFAEQRVEAEEELSTLGFSILCIKTNVYAL